MKTILFSYYIQTLKCIIVDEQHSSIHLSYCCVQLILYSEPVLPKIIEQRGGEGAAHNFRRVNIILELAVSYYQVPGVRFLTRDYTVYNYNKYLIRVRS